MDIQSNSQQESNLSILKRQIRSMCDERDTEKLMADVEENTRLFKIDINKYAKAIFDSIVGKQISNPPAYLKKVMWSIANERHTEFVKDYLPNFIEFHLKLDSIGMKGEQWEKYFIDEIITHCIQNFPIDRNEMLKTMVAIIDYCESRQTLTYRDYIRFLMASKIVKKCSVPLKMLEDKAKTEYEELEKEINKLHG